MKPMKNKHGKIVATILALASIFVITDGHKWQEPLIYTLAITMTMYSYIIAMGLAISVSVATTWSVVNSFRMAARLREDNLNLVKSMIEVMNGCNRQKPIYSE
jgi:hypothetical protein